MVNHSLHNNFAQNKTDAILFGQTMSTFKSNIVCISYVECINVLLTKPINTYKIFFFIPIDLRGCNSKYIIYGSSFIKTPKPKFIYGWKRKGNKKGVWIHWNRCLRKERNLLQIIKTIVFFITRFVLFLFFPGFPSLSCKNDVLCNSY